MLPGDGGAALDMLREADRIFGLRLTFETAAIGFDSLRTAGARIVVPVRPRDDLYTKGFQGPSPGIGANRAGQMRGAQQLQTGKPWSCPCVKLLLEVRSCKRTFRFQAYDIGSHFCRAAGDS
jgi:hypothetical protein